MDGFLKSPSEHALAVAAEIDCASEFKMQAVSSYFPELCVRL